MDKQFLDVLMESLPWKLTVKSQFATPVSQVNAQNKLEGWLERVTGALVSTVINHLNADSQTSKE